MRTLTIEEMHEVKIEGSIGDLSMVINQYSNERVIRRVRIPLGPGDIYDIADALGKARKRYQDAVTTIVQGLKNAAA